MQCSGCKTPLANTPGAVTFKCPGCGKSEICRCQHCRKIAAQYKCHDCGFTGPN